MTIQGKILRKSTKTRDSRHALDHREYHNPDLDLVRSTEQRGARTPL